MASSVKNGKYFYSRANHFIFQQPIQSFDSRIENYKKAKFAFDVSVFSYIDTPIRFEVDIAANKYEPNDEGMAKIHSIISRQY